MAIGNFTSYGAESIGKILTTTAVTDIVTVPYDDRYIVKSIIIHNADGGGVATTIQWYDASEAATVILYDATLSSGTGDDYFAGQKGPLVLAGNDILQVQAGTANAIHVSVSYMTLGRLSGRT